MCDDLEMFEEILGIGFDSKSTIMTTKFLNKIHFKKFIKDQRHKILENRRRIAERKIYWQNQLS
jgi:hypothetical protein